MPNKSEVEKAVAQFREARSEIREQATKRNMRVAELRNKLGSSDDVVRRLLDRVWDASKVIRECQNGGDLFRLICREQNFLDRAQITTLHIERILKGEA